MSTTAIPLSKDTKLGVANLCAAAKTDVGRRRSENQDSYGHAHSAHASLFIVADGMGGARGGGTASAMAVNIVIDSAAPVNGEISSERIESAITLANKVIYSRSQAEAQLSGMGTTLVALAIVDQVAVVAHVGDSRIYLMKGGELHQLTRDHTLVQELVDTGAIAPQDAANHPIAHMLTRSLGPAESAQPDVKVLSEPIGPGDKFLLCSDGLYNHVSNEEIALVLAGKSPRDSVETLVQMALDGGGSDNVTIQVIEVLGASDERGNIQRPSDGSVEKFIASEINVHEFSGVTLTEFTKSVQPDDSPQEEPTEESPEPHVDEPEASKSTAQPPSEPAAEYNGSTTQVLDSRQFSQEALLAKYQEMRQEHADEKSEVPASAPASRSESKASPYQFLVLVGAALGASFLALWLFVVPGPGDEATVRPIPMSSSSSVASEVEIPSLSFSSAESVVVETPESLSSSSFSSLAVVATEPLSSSSLSSSSLAAVETSAAPAVDINAPADSPEGALLQQELAGTTSSAAVSSRPSDSSRAAESLELTPSMKKFENILVWASDIRVPNVPPLSLGGGNSKGNAPDEPIVWEREKQIVQKILETQDAPPPPALKTNEEIAELSEKKEQSRVRVADVDAKLELLLVENKEQAKKKQARLEMEISRLDEVRKSLLEDLADASKRAAVWDELQKKVASSDPLKVADEVAPYSPIVQTKRSDYSDITEKYLRTVDEWQGKQKDTELAAQMSALGRGVKERRVELEAVVTEAISKGQSVATRQVRELRYFLWSLSYRLDQMNRQVGLVRAFAPTSVDRRREMQRKLLEERRVQLETLNQLQQSLSDEAEISYRRKNAELFFSAPA